MTSCSHHHQIPRHLSSDENVQPRDICHFAFCRAQRLAYEHLTWWFFFCSKWKITDKMTESNIKIGIVIWGFGKARNHDKFRCQSQQGQHNLNLRTNHCKASKKYNTTSVGVAVCSIHSNLIQISNRKFLHHRDMFWASARDEMPEGPQGEALVITKWGDVDWPGRMDLAVDIMISSNSWKILKDFQTSIWKHRWGDPFLPFCLNAN